jgi:hypothetical protein
LRCNIESRSLHLKNLVFVIFSTSMKTILLLAAFFLLIGTGTASGVESACSYFYKKLSQLPHSKLISNNGEFKSVQDGKILNGCEVIYESNVSLVAGSKVFELFESLKQTPGWVLNNDLVADGPGSSSMGIENETHRCLINWQQFSWIDEETQQYEQSSDIKMIVQCFLK